MFGVIQYERQLVFGHDIDPLGSVTGGEEICTWPVEVCQFGTELPIMRQDRIVIKAIFLFVVIVSSTRLPTFVTVDDTTTTMSGAARGAAAQARDGRAGRAAQAAARRSTSEDRGLRTVGVASPTTKSARLRTSA